MYARKTATIAISTVTAPTRTGLATIDEAGRRLMVRGGSRGACPGPASSVPSSGGVGTVGVFVRPSSSSWICGGRVICGFEMSRWPGSGGASGWPRPRLRPRPRVVVGVGAAAGSPTPAPSPSSASSVQRSLPLWIRLVGPSRLAGHRGRRCRLVRADARSSRARSDAAVGRVLVGRAVVAQ